MWSRGLDSFGYNNKPHLVFGLSYHPAELSNVSEPSPQWVTGFWTPHIGACWAFYDTLRWDFLSKFGDIYLIPSVQPALMGAVPMLRMLKPPFTVRSHLDFTSHKHTHTHTLIYTRIHSFSKYPKDLIFRYLLFTVWQKKIYNLKKYFSHIVVLFMYIFCSYFVPCELDFYSSRLYYYCPCKWALNKDYKNQVLFD